MKILYLAQPVYNEYGDPESMVGSLKLFKSEAERDLFVETENDEESEYEYWTTHDLEIPD